MADNAYGVDVPQGVDAFDPDGDMRGMADGDNLGAWIIVPVANITARDALEAAHGTITAARPLYVLRADAPAGREHEYTTDGVTWRTLSVDKRPFVRRVLTSAQSIATGVSTKVLFGTETHSNTTLISYSAGTFTILQDCLIRVQVPLAQWAGDTVGRRDVEVRFNGVIESGDGMPGISGSLTRQHPGFERPASSGDTVEVWALHDSTTTPLTLDFCTVTLTIAGSY